MATFTVNSSGRRPPSVTTACDICDRERRESCNSALPCSNCISLGTDCGYGTQTTNCDNAIMTDNLEEVFGGGYPMEGDPTAYMEGLELVYAEVQRMRNESQQLCPRENDSSWYLNEYSSQQQVDPRSVQQLMREYHLEISGRCIGQGVSNKTAFPLELESKDAEGASAPGVVAAATADIIAAANDVAAAAAHIVTAAGVVAAAAAAIVTSRVAAAAGTRAVAGANVAGSPRNAAQVSPDLTTLPSRLSSSNDGHCSTQYESTEQARRSVLRLLSQKILPKRNPHNRPKPLAVNKAKRKNPRTKPQLRTRMKELRRSQRAKLPSAGGVPGRREGKRLPLTRIDPKIGEIVEVWILQHGTKTKDIGKVNSKRGSTFSLVYLYKRATVERETGKQIGKGQEWFLSNHVQSNLSCGHILRVLSPRDLGIRQDVIYDAYRKVLIEPDKCMGAKISQNVEE